MARKDSDEPLHGFVARRTIVGEVGGTLSPRSDVLVRPLRQMSAVEAADPVVRRRTAA
jgi:hypothetical protein